MSSVIRVENRMYPFKSEIYNPFLWLCARRKTLLSVLIGFEIDCYPLLAQYLYCTCFGWQFWLWTPKLFWCLKCNFSSFSMVIIPPFPGNTSWNCNISKYLYFTFSFKILNRQLKLKYCFGFLLLEYSNLKKPHSHKNIS